MHLSESRWRKTKSANSVVFPRPAAAVRMKGWRLWDEKYSLSTSRSFSRAITPSAHCMTNCSCCSRSISSRLCPATGRFSGNSPAISFLRASRIMSFKGTPFTAKFIRRPSAAPLPSVCSSGDLAAGSQVQSYSQTLHLLRTLSLKLASSASARAGSVAAALV